MDYETLNKVRKIGILGCIIALVTGYGLKEILRGKVYPYTIGTGGSENFFYYWSLGAISQNGIVLLIAVPIMTVGLIVSIPLFKKNAYKAFMLISAIIGAIATVLTAQWVIPYRFFMSVDASNNIISESLAAQIPTIELLWSQSTMATILFLFLAGLVGIVIRKSDRITLVGYIITFLGGLASLAIAVAGSTALFPGLGGADWIPLASTISLVCYIGLGMVFYRPITQPEEHSDTEEQESDSRT